MTQWVSFAQLAWSKLDSSDSDTNQPTACIQVEPSNTNKRARDAPATGGAIAFLAHQTVERPCGESKVLFVEELFVMPEYRGTGASSRLMRSVLHDGVSEDETEVHLIVDRCNEAAWELYTQKWGMTELAWNDGDNARALQDGQRMRISKTRAYLATSTERLSERLQACVDSRLTLHHTTKPEFMFHDMFEYKRIIAAWRTYQNTRTVASGRGLPDDMRYSVVYHRRFS